MGFVSSYITDMKASLIDYLAPITQFMPSVLISYQVIKLLKNGTYPTKVQYKVLKLHPSKDTETQKHILVSKLFKQEIILIMRFISRGGGEQLVVTTDIRSTYNQHFLMLCVSNSCQSWV